MFSASIRFIHAPTTVSVKEDVELRSLVQEHCPSLFEPLALRPVLSNAHGSTIYSAFKSFEDVFQIYYGRYTMKHADGGINTLDFALREANFEDSPDLPPRTRLLDSTEILELGSQDTKTMVVLLHGLAGGSHESYVRAVVEHLYAVYSHVELECVAFNARGCAMSEVLSPHYWSAIKTSDFRATMQDLEKLFPNRKFIGIGFSLGANILANYLGEEGTASPFISACSISNPWNLEVSNLHLQRTFIGREIYSRRMADGLRRLFDKHSNQLLKNKSIFYEQVMSSKYLEDFDAAFTAKMYGFPTARAYYRAASSVVRLPAITTPLLILNSYDDPITGWESIPHEEVRQNGHTLMFVTSRGGHIGWYEQSGARWFVRVIGEWVALWV